MYYYYFRMEPPPFPTPINILLPSPQSQRNHSCIYCTFVGMKNTTADAPEVLLCMSTGRCGTAYLQKILSSAHFTHSLHEPSPTLAPLSTFCDEEIILPAIVEKVATILDCQPPGTTTYAETNHCLLHRHWKYFLITLLARIDP